MGNKISYNDLLDNALRGVVKEALHYAQAYGLGEKTHFYITFSTRTPGVVLPDFIKIRYPDSITIVLQHSYANLNVSETEFGVTLTFDGRPFYVRVPFAALIEFKDPDQEFMLQFMQRADGSGDKKIELPLEEAVTATPGDPRIVSFDEFRRKKK